MSGVVLLGAGVVLVAFLPLWSYILTIALVTLADFVMSFGGSVYFIHQVTVRQSATEDSMLGRVNATARFISRGAMRIGALIGAALAKSLGDHTVLLWAGIGIILSCVWVAFSPVMQLRDSEYHLPQAPSTN
ncbi:hypothetical protein [Sulfobacillus thermosulfidooxidans]|uniref:hypothetical protein n=1 Tax=Sulfobacillus thermosulfidooxidans TaxID=28034 RepID=UPI0003FC6144|nr:hypothetical protein [Sulfobacillus thermosulfidooxidans]